MKLWMSEVMAKRKSCPNCGVRVGEGNSIVSVGWYPRGYRLLWYCCAKCFWDMVNSYPGVEFTVHVRTGCSVRWYKPGGVG